MKRAWRIATTLVGVFYAQMLEYRAEIVLWAITGAFPLIMMGVWIQASASGATALRPADFERYFFAIFLVRQFMAVWVIYDFEDDVVQGRLSPALLQPLDPMFRYLAAHVGERFTRLPFIGVFIVVFFCLFPAALWHPTVGGVVLSVVGCVLGFILRFAIQYTLAMVAFWTERATSVDQFWALLFFFLSGTLAPLEIYPAAVRNFADYTPFPYLSYFQAQMLIGRPTAVAKGFVIMIGWTLVFVAINRVLWRRGLRHYSAMGA